MKTVCIVHGWDGGPEEPLLQWLKSSLEEKGYNVLLPVMPNPAEPKIEEWVGKLKEIIIPNENMIFVGHSVGCQAILRYLETLPQNIRVGDVVFIAPWLVLDETTIEEEGEEIKEIARPWMETPINFQKVALRVKRVTAIFSDNDPYVSLSQKDIFQETLGAHIIIEHEKGHFSPSDNINTLPSALEAVISE